MRLHAHLEDGHSHQFEYIAEAMNCSHNQR